VRHRHPSGTQTVPSTYVHSASGTSAPASSFRSNIIRESALHLLSNTINLSEMFSMHRSPVCFHRIWYVANNAYRRITSTKAPTPSIYSSAPSYAERMAIFEGSGLLVPQETGLESASRKFIRGELPAAEAARLERIRQNGCINEDIFDSMGYDLSTTIPAWQFVMARVVGDDENGRDAGNTEDKAGRPVPVTQA
jgi:hypothetical protein